VINCKCLRYDELFSVELHGGSVEAASRGSGMGSTFSVSLKTVQAPEKRTGVSKRAGQACRVLLVEDNADDRAVTAEIIRLGGHTVLEAANGAEALAIARNSAIDVGVIDLGLPDMDGCTVAVKLRSHAAMGTIDLIALTGYGNEAEKNRTAFAGFNEHLVKPIEPHVLLELIDRLVYKIR